MRKLNILFLVGCAFFLAGCSTYWYQEGTTFDECKQARADCFAELKKRTDFSSPTIEYEMAFINNCMMEKGYIEVSQNELPLDVKREEPPSSYHWRTRGIAGTLNE
jgi:PBP1b-binding outer membrane lipoprotein LpoB